MFGSLHNLTLSRPRIDLESLLEHFIFLNFLGGVPPNPPQREVATQKYSHHQISSLPFTNLIYTMLACYDRSIAVYKYEFDKSMLVGAIIIIKDHKMRQIINELYLLFLRNITNTNIMYV